MGERGGESTWMSLWVINANKLRRICQLVFLCSVVVSLMFLPSSTFFSSPLFLPSIFFLSTLCCFTKYNIISSKQKKCILIEIKCHYLITCFITLLVYIVFGRSAVKISFQLFSSPARLFFGSFSLTVHYILNGKLVENFRLWLTINWLYFVPGLWLMEIFKTDSTFTTWILIFFITNINFNS